MEKKMYTATLEKVRNDYAVRNIDKLEAAIKAGDMEKALELHKLNVEKKTGFHHFAVRWVNQTLRNFKKWAPDEAILEGMEDYALWCYPPCLQDWMEKYKAGQATYKDLPAVRCLKYGQVRR